MADRGLKDTMAYNLPPPWSPGFALPQNVEDEGVERRAFITKWAPRGTYDAPKVGTGGYAVPQYITDEGYGQGTFTTKWQPSGTYSGPKVPVWLNQRPQVVKEQRLPGGGKVVTVQPLGDDQPLPKVFEDYGSRAAQILIAQVAPFPAGKRAAVMKTILDKIDKSLWTRTQEIFKRYTASGVNPSIAFPQALARAMSAGIAAEIVDTGLRRAAPQAVSLLGLGCYGGSAALGARNAWAPPAFGDDAAMHWVPTAGSVPGHWETGPAGTTGTVVAVAHPDRDAAALAATGGKPKIQIGPMWFDGNVSRQAANNKHFANPPDAVIESPAGIPDDFAKTIHDFLTVPIAGGNETMRSTYVGGSEAEQWAQPDAPAWFNRFGVAATTPVRLAALRSLKVGVGNLPFAVVESPTTGEDLLLYARLIEADESQAGKGTSPLQMKFYLAKPPPAATGLAAGLVRFVLAPVGKASDATGITTVGTAIVDGGAAVVKAVGDGLNKLGDLACDLLNTPGVAQAAGAAGGAVAGIPPQAGAAAGAAGAGIAKGACGGPPPPPVPVLAPSSSVLPLAILGGGAVVVALLLMDHKRSKRKTP